MKPRIGIIGLGKIGRAAARNLIADGFEVLALERPSTLDFAGDGGHLCSSISEMAAACDTIVTCLANEAQMEEAYRGSVDGAAGLIDSAREGLVVVEMGTFPIALKQALADALAGKGAKMLDCPISGTPPVVVNRNAIMFVSGAVEVIAHVRPVIDSIAPKSLVVGAFGAGMTMKLIANLLVIVNTMAVGEAFALGAGGGLDPELILAAVGPSAGASKVFDSRGPMMARRTYQPAPGPASIVHKDLGYIRDHARALGIVTPLVETALDWYGRMLAEGRGSEECAGILETLLAASGR